MRKEDRELLELISCVRTADGLRLTYEALRKEWAHQFDNHCEIPVISPRDARDYHTPPEDILNSIMRMYLDIKTCKLND